MATYLVSHEVNDVDKWRAATTREEVFGPIGVTARAFFDPAGSNRVGLIVEIPDMDAFNALLASPDGQAAMQRDGVRPETIVLLAES
jgi:hypothetical protein